MKSTLELVLPKEIPESCEAVVLEKMKGKMRGACSMLVRIVRALEERYGEEAKELARRALDQHVARDEKELGPPEEDLHAYLEGLEKGCAGSHEWERVTDEPDRVEYRFTRCMWAEIFRELGADDIGLWICEGDDPGIRSYNPHLRCRLTKTLMKGDPYCDHQFHVEAED